MSDVQVSMMLSSVDSGLRLDSAASVDAEAGTTDAFISSFNAALNKASAKSPHHGQRQIPAAVSNLSEISLSLLKVDAKSDNQTELDAADAIDGTDELSLSLLQQIAFTKNSKQTPSAADTKPIMHNGPVAETDPEAESAELETNLVPSIINKAAKSEQEPNQKQTELNDSETADKDKTAAKLVTDDPEKLAKPIFTEQPDAAVDDLSKKSNKESNHELIDKGANARTVANDTKPIYSNEPATSAITDEIEPAAELILPNQAVKLEKSTAAATKLSEKSDVKLDVKPNAKSDLKTDSKQEAKPETKSELDLQPNLVIDETKASKSAVLEPVAAKAQSSRNEQANATKAEQTAAQSSASSTKSNVLSSASANEQVVVPTKLADAEAAAQLTEKLSPTPHNSQRSEQGFSAALANAQAATAESRLSPAPSATTASATHAEQVRQSINLMQQDAAGQMRQQVSLMLSQQIQRAEIRLDPAGLGMMQIKIDVQQEQATVQFTVQQQQAKELIEQQLPRLREMLQQQGIQLTEGQVQQQSQQQQQQLAQQGQGKQQQAGTEGSDEELSAIPIQISVRQSDRLVDYYA